MCLKSTVLFRVSSTRVPDVTLRLFGDWDIRRSMSACWDRKPRSHSMSELYLNISPEKTLLAHTSYEFLVGTSRCLMDYAKWFTKYWLLNSAFVRCELYCSNIWSQRWHIWLATLRLIGKTTINSTWATRYAFTIKPYTWQYRATLFLSWDDVCGMKYCHGYPWPSG